MLRTFKARGLSLILLSLATTERQAYLPWSLIYELIREILLHIILPQRNDQSSKFKAPFCFLFFWPNNEVTVLCSASGLVGI